MVIVVNTISLLQQEDYRNLIFECFSRITNLYPEHLFVFISNNHDEFSFPSSSNIICAVLHPKLQKPLLLKPWYNYKITAILKKYKAGIYISSNDFYPLRTKVPQLLIVGSLAGFNDPAHMEKRDLQRYRERTLKNFKKAKLIVTLSDLHKDAINKDYKIDASKVEVIYSGAGEIYTPVDLTEKLNIMEEYSGGNEYFLFPATIYHENILLNLLKAYSFFKKWQKSSMQLLIVTGNSLQSNQYKSHLRLFKYRNEVKVLEKLPANTLAKITASAYVMIYISIVKGFSMPPMQAMKCNIPVIAGNDGVIAEICNNAALYVDPLNHEDIAKKMMLVFKDEKLKKELIEKGNEQIKKYSWERTSRLLWQSILKATR